MPPSKQPVAPFAVDERVFCFHMEMLYEARILDVQQGEGGEGWQYKIHYKGWKNTWDDWVPQDRVRKFNDENKELASQLREQIKALQQKSSKVPKKGGRANGSDFSSARGSEERTAGQAATSSRGPRRAPRDFDLEQEDNFHARPTIKLAIPDQLKALLVDDWENVTKNNQLVPLPHVAPVDKILADYLAFERRRREEGSAAMDILDETIAGLREYFDKCLGRILLYRFERYQYKDFRDEWESNPEGGHKSACDTYGAEHLSRLLVSLPELIAQTTMDQQSVNRLREELTILTTWLTRNASKYFVPEYETPSQEYVDKARSV